MDPLLIERKLKTSVTILQQYKIEPTENDNISRTEHAISLQHLEDILRTLLQTMLLCNSWQVYTSLRMHSGDDVPRIC